MGASELTFEELVRAMSADKFAYLLDRSIFVIEEAKRRGVLGPASDDAFQRALDTARAEGRAEGRREMRVDALAAAEAEMLLHEQAASAATGDAHAAKDDATKSMFQREAAAHNARRMAVWDVARAIRSLPTTPPTTGGKE